MKYPKRHCLRMDSTNHRRKTSLFFCSAKPSKRCHDIATCIGLVRLAPPAEEQSGDRQRREKGPPILTAEKDEHERAPRECEIYPTLLCATLRAPPSKWAIKAFFPKSPCRVLSLVLSFASKERTSPLGGGSPTTRARVGASAPAGDCLQQS